MPSSTHDVAHLQPETGPSPLQSALLTPCGSAGIVHGFFTRHGGVSSGIYAGLNIGLGSNDDPADVHENRVRVAGWFGREESDLVTVHQVHSPNVVTVTEPFGSQRPQVDAMVTDHPGLILGALAADCGPILFADPVNRVIGAAHAGWKGALTGVLENTIEAMIVLGATRASIVATLGPSISAKAYEVGPEFVERFLAHDPAYQQFFTPSTKPGHSMFDLPGLTVKRLTDAGIAADMLGLCTYGDPDRFFSYRRTTHAGEPDYGRQISAIMLQGPRA
ncbi:peptidoglycan editing factor PgeF [Agrobacterium vitis]|uniref:peptidoglycan editing factor PgeF n=1 Tax=Agrobacterium vitis TaxID=373 RepID=UPI0012E85504|nr:peptidoglycan editing factor PgeF [Agrobacterium vitis]MVA81224.1 peptidoglycan editing factor PgeF [Agrobacterium vitis]